MAITTAGWATFTAGVPSGATNASATISPPTGLSAGDTWVIAVSDWDGLNASFNTPSGFTKQSTSWNDGATGNCSVTLWYKPNCTGSETSVTITDTGSGTLFAGATWRHSGAATSTPFVDISDGSFSVQAVPNTATKLVSPGAAHTPAQNNEIVYFLVGTGSGQDKSNGGNTFSTASGWTQLGFVNASTTSTSDRADLSVFYQVQTTAAAVPVSGTNSPASTITFAGGVFTQYGCVGAVISFYAAAGGSTNVSTSDSGTGTDTATIGVLAAESGTAADALTVVATITIADSGAGTDIAVIGITAAETGTGGDGLSLAAAVPATDSGTGTESPTLSAVVPATETGTGADTGLIGLATGETGTSADSPALVATVTSTDSGSGTDNSSLRLTAGETGTGSDASTLAAMATAAEAGSGADSGAVGLAAVEAGSGTDAPTLTAAATTSDTASGGDSTALRLPVSETGAAGDAGTLSATATLGDSGTGSDAASSTGNTNVTTSDSGAGSDGQALTASGATAESGAASDALPTLAAGLTSGESAGGTDAPRGGMTAIVPETAIGADNAGLAAALTAGEAGGGTDSAASAAQGSALTTTESGAGSDTAAVPVQGYTLTETGSATDTLALAAALTLAEIAAALEHLSSSGAAVVIRAAFRALARTTRFAASARLTHFAAPSRTTQFKSMGDLDMPMQPITPGGQPAVLRSGDTKEVFSGDFAADLAAGEVLTACTFTIKGVAAQSVGSTLPDPASTWTDVTATVAAGGTPNPSPSPDSGAYVGTVAMGTGGAVSVAQTSGLGHGTPGMTYICYFYVTTSTGRTLMDAIAGPNGAGGLVADM